jgi:hypothetical protein
LVQDGIGAPTVRCRKDVGEDSQQLDIPLALAGGHRRVMILQESPDLARNGEVFYLYRTELLEAYTGTGIEFMVAARSMNFDLGYGHPRDKSTDYKSAMNNMFEHEDRFSWLPLLLLSANGATHGDLCQTYFDDRFKLPERIALKYADCHHA